uniref:Uncharacterized protein n=1 Tax=Oncorhynchus mykiss TaxID=8022 RepID=A0A8C7RD81_ONCMY
MFSSTWNFLKRHKMKCIFAGTFVGFNITLTASQECLPFHFESNQRTCNMTVLSIDLICHMVITPRFHPKCRGCVQCVDMLIVLHHVQLNIICGYLYMDNSVSKN